MKEIPDLQQGQLSYHDVSQMMAEMFKKIREDNDQFSPRTDKEELHHCYKIFSEIISVRHSTTNSLFHMFLDEYKKSTELTVQKLKK